MSLGELSKISITQFKGLYRHGMEDSCPPDHSTVAQNLRYSNIGEAFTRDGTTSSFTAPCAVKRMFVANFGHIDFGILLTCDGLGNIFRSDTGTILLTVTNMVDFFAINIFSYVLISPILSTPNPYNPVYIWQADALGGPDTIPIRPAAGVGPGLGMTGVENSIPGNCDIGVHKFAVSFITDTGYTTQPGPLGTPTPAVAENPTFTPVAVTSTGGVSIQLDNIPLGPPGTVARQILVTQADQELFYYAGGQRWNGFTLSYDPWNGIIPDNLFTSIIISFFDTDLAVQADSLFDLLPVIPGGSYSLIAGITDYSGRVFYWGGEFNLIRVTNPGSAEAIDNVNGFIQLQDQFDGNDVIVGITLQNALYFMKPVGIYSVVDNGGNPNTWQVVTVDAGAGCSSAMGLGTANLARQSLTRYQLALLSDFGGLYLFNGTVIQPPLTHKISDLWDDIYRATNWSGVRIAIDPYQKLIYIASIPNYPNILVADYHEGLDPENIKWSIWTFSYTINDIGMAFIKDDTELAYRLRIASGNKVNKLVPGLLTDLGTPIVSTWRSAPLTPEEGALNVFRYLRARMPYNDNLSLTLFSEDGAFIQNPPGFNIPYTPGRDLTREFNFMNEKCEIQICCNATKGGFRLQRLDVFCKPRFAMRPSV